MSDTNTDTPPAVSGRTCVGVSFDVQGAYYRRCGWDGSIQPGQIQLEPCSNCKRIVKDKELGTVDGWPTKAVQVYLPPGTWYLVQVPQE